MFQVRQHGTPLAEDAWPTPRPWTLNDGSDDEDIKEVMQDNHEFILAQHRMGDVESTFNFPVSGNLLRQNLNLVGEMHHSLTCKQWYCIQRQRGLRIYTD